MTYSRPELVSLGSVTSVIEYIGAKPYPNFADWVFGHNPAYDLDE